MLFPYKLLVLTWLNPATKVQTCERLSEVSSSALFGHTNIIWLNRGLLSPQYSSITHRICQQQALALFVDKTVWSSCRGWWNCCSILLTICSSSSLATKQLCVLYTQLKAKFTKKKFQNEALHFKPKPDVSIAKMINSVANICDDELLIQQLKVFKNIKPCLKSAMDSMFHNTSMQPFLWILNILQSIAHAKFYRAIFSYHHWKVHKFPCCSALLFLKKACRCRIQYEICPNATGKKKKKKKHHSLNDNAHRARSLQLEGGQFSV